VPIGQGGFGKVRVGHDTILDRKIAIKTLDPVWNAADAEDKERFKREARTLAKLSHPNIPAIYDVFFGSEHDKLQIVFQFVEGENLREILKAGPLGLLECRAWLDQIAAGLDHAHANKIIHRDVKPENMIVSADRRHCYLVDFGIALSQEEFQRLTGSGGGIGTPGYMSPEQEAGKLCDPSDDLYALGICLYEGLCGHRIQPGDYKPLNGINETIPPAIDTLILKCVADKPLRLGSAAEFRKELKSALHGHKSLSEILFSGALHEIVGTIREMTPDEFMAMRPGQRLLILGKFQDVASDTERKLELARDEFLIVLTPLGIHLEAGEYSKIIEPAIRCGFGVIGCDGSPTAHGNYRIREALTTATMKVDRNHHTIASALLAWLNSIDLASQKRWFCHSIRPLLNALMANPNCIDEDAPLLASMLSHINDLQRSKAHESDQETPSDAD
jgi:serine/threonine-protein kinase